MFIETLDNRPITYNRCFWSYMLSPKTLTPEEIEKHFSCRRNGKIQRCLKIETHRYSKHIRIFRTYTPCDRDEKRHNKRYATQMHFARILSEFIMWLNVSYTSVNVFKLFFFVRTSVISCRMRIKIITVIIIFALM